MGRSTLRAVDDRIVQVPAGSTILEGNLNAPEAARGIVLFAHGSGSSRHSPRNRFVAAELQKAGLATLLIDLLTPDEEAIDLRTRHLPSTSACSPSVSPSPRIGSPITRRLNTLRSGPSARARAAGRRSSRRRIGPISSARSSRGAAVPTSPERPFRGSEPRRCSSSAGTTAPSSR